MNVLTDNPVLIALAAILVVLLLFLLLRPKQRVTLMDEGPTRPHMAGPGEGKSLADEAAAAASDVTGDIIDAKVHAELPGASSIRAPPTSSSGPSWSAWARTCPESPRRAGRGRAAA